MKQVIAIVLVLCTVLTIGSAFPLSVSAEEWHTNWTKVGNVVENEDKVVLRAELGEESYITLGDGEDIGEQFDVSWTMKVNSYNDSACVQIWTGTHRAYLVLHEDKITMAAPNGSVESTTFLYDVGYQAHDYRMIAKDGQGSLFIDGIFAGEFLLEVREGTQKVHVWLNGNKNGSAEVEISDMEIHPLPVVAGEDSSRLTAFDSTFDDGTYRYGWTGNNDAGYWVVKDGIMTGYSTIDSAAATTRSFDIQPNQDFVIDVKFKVLDFGGTRGIQWFWEGRKIDMRIYKEYLTIGTADGSVTSDPISIADKDWHYLRIEAYNNGKCATVYMDDIAVADFVIASSERTDYHIYAYVIGAGGNPCSLIFDYFKYTEIPCEVKVWQPYDGVIYREGQDVVLSANPNVTGDVPYLDYKINGQTVATATKENDYKTVATGLPVGAYTMTAEYGDYVSGKMNFKVISAVTGEIQSEYKKNGDLKVSLPVTNQGISEIANVEYLLDGQTVASATEYPYEAVVSDITPGRHILTAVCYNDAGIALSKFSADLTPELSIDTETSTHYANEISYEVTGESGVAEINLRNGNHQLWIQHTPEQIWYHTDTEVEKYEISGTGKYTILTDGPVADIYRNGQLLVSYYMPRAEISKRCFYESGLLIQNYQVSVPEEKKTYFVKRNVQEKDVVYQVPDIPYYYNLDFVANQDNNLHLAVNDGYYHVDITLKNGKIFAWVTDKNRSDPYQKELCDAVDTAEDVYYRVEVSAGLCRIYGDGRWLSSFRAMHTSGRDSFLMDVTAGNALKYVAICDNTDLHLFEDSFDNRGELPSQNFWQTTGMDVAAYGFGSMEMNAVNAENAILEMNAYAGNLDFSAKVMLEYCDEGGFWVLLNHSVSDTYTKIGYNFADGQYELIDVTDGTESVLGSKAGEFPLGETVQLNLKAEKLPTGKRVTFWVDDEEIFAFDGAQERYGTFGFMMSKAMGQVEEVSYRGDAKVVYGVQNDPGRTTGGSDMIENGDKIIMIDDSGDRVVTTDGGKTWFKEARVDGDSSSVVTLSSGEMIGLRREVVSEENVTPILYSYISYISTDGGASWTKQGPVQEEGLPYRITMPNRVTQGPSGRIYFACCENNDETYGYTVIYYSDNKGATWTASQTVMDAMETGYCIQEVVCLETENDTVRAYFRNDLGFIQYFNSYDKGVTWDLTPHKTPFYSALNCFNVQRDPYDTTGKTLFAAWGYDNPNLAATPQYPRTRWSVARSSDGGETWESIGTVQEDTDNGFSTMNLSINVAKDYLVLSAMSLDHVTKTVWYQRKVTLPKNQKGSKRFDQVHMLTHDAITVAQMLPETKAERVMLVHPDSGTVMVQDSRMENAAYDGYVALDCAAAFVGAFVSEGSDGAVILRYGSASVTIPADSIATQNGKKFVNLSAFTDAYNLYVIDADGTKIVSPYNDWSENQKKGLAASIEL